MLKRQAFGDYNAERVVRREEGFSLKLLMVTQVAWQIIAISVSTKYFNALYFTSKHLIGLF